MNAETALSWTLLLPLAGAPIIYLIGRLVNRSSGHGQSRIAGWLSLVFILATGYTLSLVAPSIIAGQDVQIQVNNIGLHMDGIGLILAATVVVLGAMVLLFSILYMAGEQGEEKYYALLTAMMGSMIGLGCASDLFNLWVWFEAMAVTSYMLVAFYFTQAGSLEAGFKYLVQSAAGSVFVLTGIVLVFAQTGSLSLADIQSAVGLSNPLMLAAGAAFLIGFGVKSALVPLHTWLPDAHSQAPSGISAMLSGVVIEAGLVALLRALGCLSNVTSLWGGILLGFGALNMIVGNLMALRQTQVKRLLAYSSVSHIGYMLIGLGAAFAFKNASGAGGSFFHIFTHGLMKGLAFLSAGVLLYTLYISKGSLKSLMVEDLNGASKKYPLTAFTFSVAVLALGGLPPLAGFMSKWQIFVGGVQTGNTAVILLVVFAAINSVLSLAYYAPLVNRMYRKEPSEVVKNGSPAPVLIAIPLVVLTLFIVVLGFWPTLITPLTAPAASSLLAILGG